MASRSLLILCIFVLREEKVTILATISVQVMVILKYIQNQQASPGYIFRVLQHFAAKLGNSTNFRMLFLTVVKDFVRLAQMQSWSIMQIVHWSKKVRLLGAAKLISNLQNVLHIFKYGICYFFKNFTARLLEYYIFLCYNFCSFFVVWRQNFVCEIYMCKLYTVRSCLSIMKIFDCFKKSYYKIYVTQFTITTTF